MKMEEGKAQVFTVGGVGRGWGVVGVGETLRWLLLSHWCEDLWLGETEGAGSLGSFISVLYSGFPTRRTLEFCVCRQGWVVTSVPGSLDALLQSEVTSRILSPPGTVTPLLGPGTFHDALPSWPHSRSSISPQGSLGITLRICLFS